VAGEVVVDLGSGGGLDVFLASRKWATWDRDRHRYDGSNDRAGAGRMRRLVGIRTSSFIIRPSTGLPLDDDSVDCVISNCVLNLAPDKPAVFSRDLSVCETPADGSR